ncbi:MAG: aldose epimerase family protein [Acidobacteriaceae bacterium]
MRRLLVHGSALLGIGLSMLCFSSRNTVQAREYTLPSSSASSLPEIGGQQAIVLRRTRTGNGKRPEFLSVTLLPGRGMNVFQITAYLPGKGEVSLMSSPSLQQAAKILNGKAGDADGNESFMMGGALLFPFANRILGPATADGKYILATWHGRTIPLRANWRGSRPGAAPQALHGQILMARAASVKLSHAAGKATATTTYVLPAQGHWFSDNAVMIRVTLQAHALTVSLTATNTGRHSEPVGIGWHPYFRLPSGTRANARLHVPAQMRAAVNNPDDMFPTGKLLPVQGTPYDFTAATGAPIRGTVNDAFLQLQRNAQGHTLCDITDLAANYGLQIAALTPLVRTILVYSPADQPLIVLEPQFNNGDPFGPEWKGKSNGMVTVKPGGNIAWKTRLTLFQPNAPVTIPK